jgi:hypothetical protein
MQGQITDPKTALSFMLAGKATVTLRSLASGNRYTYKITAKEQDDKYPATWFVKLLNGPDNYSNYVYIGMIRNNCGNRNVTAYEFSRTAASKVDADAPSVLGITFVVKQLVAGNMNGFEVWHEGKYGRCVKKLTVPESIASGFGPECIKLAGGVAAVAASVVASGTPAQSNLNFDGSKRVKANPVAMSGATTKIVSTDAEIRRRIQEYKSDAPENYYQDGELSEGEAFKVAYAYFAKLIEQGR